jgi:hypothetical protein
VRVPVARGVRSLIYQTADSSQQQSAAVSGI